MTVKDIEEQARIILLDTDESAYRFAPKEIFLALKQGISEVKRLRPESRYVSGLLIDFNLSVPQSFTQAQLDEFRQTTINMDDFFQQALIFFVVYRMYLKDDPDTNNNQLAKDYLAFFQGEVA